MPRIDAENIAEHVARQELRVFECAIGLFAERGYPHVSLADIASEVGLARNSLYRYFPNKASILVRWFESELARQLERSRELLDREGDPLELILAWADDQLDYAARPEHRLMTTTESIEPDLAPEFRSRLAASHAELMAPLRGALCRAGLIDPIEADVTVELISGMILAAARLETRGADAQVTRRRLCVSIRALVG